MYFHSRYKRQAGFLQLYPEIGANKVVTGGGIMAGGSLSSLHLGQKIVVIGFFVQIVFFGFFIIVALSFDFAIHKVPTPEASSRANPWHKHLSVLYLASILIMIRSI